MKKTNLIKAAAVLSMLVLALVITGVPGIALATVTNVIIKPGSGQNYSIPVGGTIDLEGIITSSGTYTTQYYLWMKSGNLSLSSDNTAMTQVTGMSPGSGSTSYVQLKGTDDTDITGRTVSVNIAVNAMTLTPSKHTMNGGDTTSLTLSNALPGSVVWSSDNTNVATVDPSTGLISAVGAGKANITATSDPGGGALKQDESCEITVNPKISITPKTQNITAANTPGQQIVLTVEYGGDLISDASTVTWSSSVGNLGTINGSSPLSGSSTLTATANFTSSASAVNGTTRITALIGGAGNYSNAQYADVTVKTTQYLEIVGPSNLDKNSRTGNYTVYLKNPDGTTVDNDTSTVHWDWSSSYLSLTSDSLNDRRDDMHDGEAHIQLYARYNTPSAGTHLYVWLDSNSGYKEPHTIYITGLSSLPQTGQDMTLVYVFGGLGAALLIATGVLYGIRKKRTVA